MRRTARRGRAAVGAAILLTAGGVLGTAPVSAQADAPACTSAPPSNGTGWAPGSSAASLPSTTPRPGPELLYRDAPRAPQLENTGRWRAEPIMVSGASAYRDGEFLYQDHLYDEAPLAYPAEPARYGGNAADLVELRVRPEADGLAFRLTYNTLLDPAVTATTLALGGSTEAFAMPHGAGARMPAEVFVTVHGCSAHVVEAATGRELDARLTVSVDQGRRQVHLVVPRNAFDARRATTLRLGAAVGLWDEAAGSYLRPDEDAPAFYNVAFRYDEPLGTPNAFGFNDGTFRNSRQNAALQTGDLSEFAATVDVAKLVAGRDDDMPDRPGGVPHTGAFSRIYASHFETAQGRGNFAGNVVYPGYEPCDAPCSPPLAGQLQPYSIYIPATPAPRSGRGVLFFHHGAGENYNSFIDRARRFADLDEGRSLAITTESRGPEHWEFEQGGADLFEVWADVARAYRLDPERAVMAGQSLGGYATWKNATQWPDLWSAAAPHIGAVSPVAAYVGPPVPSPNGESTLIAPLLPSLRHVPVVYWVAQQDELVPWPGTHQVAQRLSALGYRLSYRAYAGDHVTTGLGLRDYDDQGRFVAGRTVERDPARISYVFSRQMHQPAYGLTSDHAYWLSGITLRDGQDPSARGTVEAVSSALDGATPAVVERSATTGTTPTLIGGAPVPWAGEEVTWSSSTPGPKADRLTLELRNIRTLTVHAARAGLTCDADIDVISDGPVTVDLAGCPRRAAGRDTSANSSPGADGSRLPATGGSVPAAGLAVVLLGSIALLLCRHATGGTREHQ